LNARSIARSRFTSMPMTRPSPARGTCYVVNVPQCSGAAAESPAPRDAFLQALWVSGEGTTLPANGPPRPATRVRRPVHGGALPGPRRPGCALAGRPRRAPGRGRGVDGAAEFAARLGGGQSHDLPVRGDRSAGGGPPSALVHRRAVLDARA